MSRSEILVVVLGYLFVVFTGYKAGTEMPEPAYPEPAVLNFISGWTAISLASWGLQWLLTKYVLDHRSPQVIVWSIVVGLMTTIVVNMSRPSRRPEPLGGGVKSV